MKKFIVILTFVGLSSCVSIKQIGKVNMISNRNIESSADYVLIKTYMGTSQNEIRNSKAKTIEDAIDQVVKSTPGGEYLKNVKIYITSKKYLAVEGDVWGITDNANFMGFKVGDRVKWTKLFKDYTGTIVDLKNDEVCTINTDADNDVVEVGYDSLTKIGN